MRLVIIGQGAIGSLLTLKCIQNDIPYGVITRHPSTVPMTFPDEALVVTPTVVEPCNIQPDDIIIVPTKAYQVMDALHTLAPFIHHQPVVLFHNGMGVKEAIQAQYPNLCVYAATTQYGALKTSPTSCHQTGQGKTAIGGIQNTHDELDQKITHLLDKLFPPCEWQPAIEKMLWQKLAINCAINPLTAIKQCRNGELLNHVDEIMQICEEICQVMSTCGISLATHELYSEVIAVCQSTASNYSSMNRDVHFNRFTEIEHITGYLLNQADLHGLETPLNRQIYERIIALDIS